jgi:hypothetical protein
MKFRHRRAEEIEEGESYYVSMTDMMVGVLFIFIIMFSYFALNYRATTATLTRAKDGQTALLLQMATALERRDTSLEIDRTHHIVCIPSAVLTDNDTNGDRRCFAYSDSVTSPRTKVETTAALASADKAAFMSSVGIALEKTDARTEIDNAALVFSIDQLFIKDTATLSPAGYVIAQQVADTLAEHLPCYAYGVKPPTPCINTAKMALVNVVSSVSLNVATPEGRAAQALALEQSVTFHNALINSRPDLAKLRNSPDGRPGSQALLQMASIGQSQSATNNSNGGAIVIQFYIAQ